VGGLQFDEYFSESAIGGGCTKCLEPKTLALNCDFFHLTHFFIILVPLVVLTEVLMLCSKLWFFFFYLLG